MHSYTTLLLGLGTGIPPLHIISHDTNETFVPNRPAQQQRPSNDTCPSPGIVPDPMQIPWHASPTPTMPTT
jgi:hypothetical protein